MTCCEEKRGSGTTGASAPVVSHARTAIRRGSKSFSFASRLLSRPEREAAMMLYAWCRYCDDRTDIKDRTTSYDEKLRNLRDLVNKTASIYRGEMPPEPEFAAMAYVVRKYEIPPLYPEELLLGMAMDLHHQGFETLQDLLHYCYRVAGVVGLMMVHVMRVSDERALRHAQDLGMAMQLTNIARDIIEDANMGRIYIPRQWMREEGLEESAILAAESRPKLAMIARRLISEAELLYRSGDEGVQYLPWAAAISTFAARRIYSAIGEKVVRRGAAAWDSRTYTRRWQKLALLVPVIWHLLLSMPARLRHPWRPVDVRTVWRFAKATEASPV